MANEEFEKALRQTSRELRRLPSEVRKAIAARAVNEVAAPTARVMAGRFTGPWAPVLAAGTKARKQADPTLVVGGSRPVVSGGASVRQLVYGNEWGGGRRRTTQQFRTARPAIIPTIRTEAPTMLDAWANIVLETFDQTVTTQG